MLRLFVILLSLLSVSSSYAKSEMPVLLPAESVQVRSSSDPAHYPKDAPILLVSCVDYRFPDEIADFMEKRGALDKYDHVILAGASLGIDNHIYPEFKKTFLTQLHLLKELHHFKMVVILDHRDCGVFKMIHGHEHAHNRKQETELHRRHLYNVRDLIISEYPDMKVELLLMSVDGSVETIK